jgi:hypothetical protein
MVTISKLQLKKKLKKKPKKLIPKKKFVQHVLVRYTKKKKELENWYQEELKKYGSINR